MNKRAVAVVGMAAIVPTVLGGLALSAPGADAHRTGIPFDEGTMNIEVNSTDGDAGIQLFLDGEPWRSVEVRAPDGRKLVDVDATGRLKDFGLTELFSESNEPPLEEQPLEEFLTRFPEGEYQLSGTTIEGERLSGTATLTHAIPPGPVIVAPEEDAVVSPDALVVEWETVDEPGIDIVGYQVIVERDDPLRVLQVDLPATATSVTVPAEFLEPDTEHDVEVLAIEASGNQTISELGFVTG